MELISGLIIIYLSWDYNGFNKQTKEVDDTLTLWTNTSAIWLVSAWDAFMDSPLKVNKCSLKSDVATDLESNSY